MKLHASLLLSAGAVDAIAVSTLQTASSPATCPSNVVLASVSSAYPASCVTSICASLLSTTTTFITETPILTQTEQSVISPATVTIQPTVFFTPTLTVFETIDYVATTILETEVSTLVETNVVLATSILTETLLATTTVLDVIVIDSPTPTPNQKKRKRNASKQCVPKTTVTSTTSTACPTISVLPADLSSIQEACSCITTGSTETVFTTFPTETLIASTIFSTLEAITITASEVTVTADPNTATETISNPQTATGEITETTILSADLTLITQVTQVVTNVETDVLTTTSSYCQFPPTSASTAPPQPTAICDPQYGQAFALQSYGCDSVSNGLYITVEYPGFNVVNINQSVPTIFYINSTTSFVQIVPNSGSASFVSADSVWTVGAATYTASNLQGGSLIMDPVGTYANGVSAVCSAPFSTTGDISPVPFSCTTQSNPPFSNFWSGRQLDGELDLIQDGGQPDPNLSTVFLQAVPVCINGIP